MFKTLILVLSFASISRQSYAQSKHKVENSNIAPVETAHFTLKRKRENIALPDSLRGAMVKGFVVVRVLVSPSGKHRLENILKIKISDPGQYALSYDDLDFAKGEIPYVIRNTAYYNLIKEYVNNDVYFIPSKGLSNKLDEPMDFIIRFK